MHNAAWTDALADEAERAIGHRFSDRALLKTCFTHASCSNITGEPSNERLEFLGDAVLGLCVTERLYRRFGEDEGHLTDMRQRCVSQRALELAESGVGLLRFLRYAGGDDVLRGKTRSNLFEAVVGALYIDGGLAAAQTFLDRTLSMTEEVNYKSLLQEYVQQCVHITPVYRVSEAEAGYVCTVAAMGAEAQGFGANKKHAEVRAAQALYEILIKRERH